MAISGKNGDNDDDDGGGGNKDLAQDMLSSARCTQPCSFGGHGVAPRVAVAVAVSRKGGKEPSSTDHHLAPAGRPS